MDLKPQGLHPKKGPAFFLPGKFKCYVLLYFLFIACLVIPCTLKAQNDSLSVIKNWLQYADAPNSLYHFLESQADIFLNKRVTEINDITTKEQWQERQKEIRETLMKIVGPFPARTPLNPKVLRNIDKKTYRIEHIVFESQPGFYVTSTLFLPKGLKGKAPVIIYCSGHSNNGYRDPVYQHVILNLVSKGFIVFAFDPVGQGERLEYFDPEKGRSTIGGPTSEHSWPGAQAFIAGSSQAMYMIFDGIRAVDYLLTRKEIDPARIGITGRSGGGTQSAYIAAFDDRIFAAAPECYITSFKRLLQSIGPQDAEQNFINEIAEGIDHPDLLEVRAPKPALMITTTNDFFSIQGARETADEISAMYKLFAKENNFAMVEDLASHASTKKNRETMYAFFQKSLNNPGNPYDETVEPLSADELKVTETGQVSTSFKSETVFSLNRKYADHLINHLRSDRTDVSHHLAEVKNSVARITGFHLPEYIPQPVFTGEIQRQGYVIKKYFIKGEGGYPVPYLLFIPKQANGKGLIYLNSSGKDVNANTGGDIEWFVHNNITVLAPDLSGTGELGSGNLSGDSEFKDRSGNIVSYNIWFTSILTGKSISGIRAGEVIRLTSVLRNTSGISGILGYADQGMSPVLLQAAVLDRDIAGIALNSPLISYASVVINNVYDPVFVPGAVAGMLRSYDLADLEACLAPRRLLMVNIADQSGIPASPEMIGNEFPVVYSAFSDCGKNDNLIIEKCNSQAELRNIFLRWLK